MKAFFILWPFFLLVHISAAAQKLKTYSFEEIETLRLTEKKMLVVLTGTDWCRYCQMMKEITLKDEAVVKLLNNNFYFIYLNAEQNKSIKFNGQEFKLKPTGLNTGWHELAIALATINGNISFPTICILNSSNEIIFQYQHYINKEGLLKLLNSL